MKYLESDVMSYGSKKNESTGVAQLEFCLLRAINLWPPLL